MKILNFSVLTSLLLLSSCASFNTANVAPGYTEAFTTIKNAIVGYESDFITPELIQNIPYASSTLKIGKGPKGLLILESIQGKRFTWVSADGIFMIIEDGKIIQTSGLEHNLTKIERSRKSLRYLLRNQVSSYKNYYSFDNPALNNLELTVTYKSLGKTNTKLINNELNLLLIEEEIFNHQIGWNVKNRYWIDENDLVWKSEQSISPKLPLFRIEVTKKPSG